MQVGLGGLENSGGIRMSSEQVILAVLIALIALVGTLITLIVKKPAVSYVTLQCFTQDIKTLTNCIATVKDAVTDLKFDTKVMGNRVEGISNHVTKIEAKLDSALMIKQNS